MRFCPVLYVFCSHAFCTKIIVRWDINMALYSICYCLNIRFDTKYISQPYSFLQTKTYKKIFVTKQDVNTTRYTVQGDRNIKRIKMRERKTVENRTNTVQKPILCASTLIYMRQARDLRTILKSVGKNMKHGQVVSAA